MQTIALPGAPSVALVMTLLAEPRTQSVVATPQEVLVNSAGTHYLNLSVEGGGTVQVARRAFDTMLSGASTTAGKPRSVFGMLTDGGGARAGCC
jgi:hypothetical protein